MVKIFRPPVPSRMDKTCSAALHPLAMDLPTDKPPLWLPARLQIIFKWVPDSINPQVARHCAANWFRVDHQAFVQFMLHSIENPRHTPIFILNFTFSTLQIDSQLDLRTRSWGDHKDMNGKGWITSIEQPRKVSFHLLQGTQKFIVPQTILRKSLLPINMSVKTSVQDDQFTARQTLELDTMSKSKWQGVQLVQDTNLAHFTATGGPWAPTSLRKSVKATSFTSSLPHKNNGSWFLDFPTVGKQHELHEQPNRMTSDAYKGADAKALLRLPPTKVVKTTWPGGARSGNMDDENSVPGQTMTNTLELISCNAQPHQVPKKGIKRQV